MSKKSVVKVYLMDNTFVSIGVMGGTTVEELWEATAKKLGLTKEAAVSFFIWAVSKDLEILLYAESSLNKCQEEWDDWLDMYCPEAAASRDAHSPRGGGAGGGGGGGTLSGTMTFGKSFTLKSFGNHRSEAGDFDKSFKYVFRPASVVPMTVELGIDNDKEALRLLYLQAVYNVTHSLYPCTESEALELAGMALQIGLGDFDGRIHRHGFLGAHELPKYLPKFYLRTHKPDVWESLLFTSHQKHQGKSQMHVYQDYLAMVRRWDYYGCTFFSATAQGRTAYYAKDYEGVVSLGVNEHGFHIIDPAINKAVSFSYERILSWDAIQSTGKGHRNAQAPNMLSVTVAGEKNPRVTFVFNTLQAELVYDLMFDWVDELDAADGKTGQSDIQITVSPDSAAAAAAASSSSAGSRSRKHSTSKKGKRRSGNPIK